MIKYRNLINKARKAKDDSTPLGVPEADRMKSALGWTFSADNYMDYH